MKLLGEWNWYLPRWLNWLPKLEHIHAGTRAGSTSVRRLDRELRLDGHRVLVRVPEQEHAEAVALASGEFARRRCF